MNSIPNLKPGEVRTEQTAEGIKVYAYNEQWHQTKCIGTIKSQRYEKDVVIYRNRNSINLPREELAAVLKAGATMFGGIHRKEGATYAISLRDFCDHADYVSDKVYGLQRACPLKYFQREAKIVRRNAAMDNPPIPRDVDIIQERQMVMFP